MPLMAYGAATKNLLVGHETRHGTEGKKKRISLVMFVSVSFTPSSISGRVSYHGHFREHGHYRGQKHALYQ